MKPDDRLWWIERYVLNSPTGSVSVVDQEFVDAYIQATGAHFRPCNFGAHKCTQLARDLSKAVEHGILRRGRVSIGEPMYGFPRWVYVYSHAVAQR